MYITTTGLILREADYKESSRMLTILTPSHGKISASARGVRRRGSKIAAATQLLTYSELTLFESKGGWTVTEGRVIEEFRGLRDDIVLLALGSYLAQVLETVSDEDVAEPGMLALGLNSLFALSEKTRPVPLVKAAFELRLMCYAGFEPMLDSCVQCGAVDPEGPCLDLAGGILRCGKCDASWGDEAVRLNWDVLKAMRFIESADSKKIFSFSLNEQNLALLGRVCEKYLLSQLGHGFKTLDFYKSLSAAV